MMGVSVTNDATASAPPVRTVLRGAWWPGDVAIVDGIVTGLGEVPALPGDEVIDCSGDIITPGLVNAHHHLAQSMTRGQGVELALTPWLKNLYPRWGAMDAEDVRSAALFGLVELALSGCTLAADHHYVVPRSDDEHFDAIADAAREVGLRLYLARGAIDLGESDGGLAPDSDIEDTEAALASMEAVAGRLHDGDMTWIALAPNSAHSATHELMRETAVLGERLGLRLHTHLSETPEVVALYERRWGARPVQVLSDLGWIGPSTWVAHATHLDDAEVAWLGREGVGVAHCPSGNARLGTGICRVVDLVAAGSPVGLGVDGGAVNESLALQPEMRQALYLARLRGGGPSCFSPADALRAATVGGAACLGLEDRFGTLEVGREADLAVWPAADLHDFPEPIDALVMGAHRGVRHLFVGGRRIVSDGELVSTDGGAALRDLQERSRRLRARH
jgi:cytosine/adenosine deaminase-related metal-dependent hydrolase